MPGKFKILSLDGGGTWALLQVRALQAIYGEDTKGHDVLSHFDLVAANSGGSITAAGLFANLPLNEVLGLFTDPKTLQKIFVKVGLLEHPIDTVLGELGLGPKYSTKDKLEGLRKVFSAYRKSFPSLTLKDASDWVYENVGKRVKLIITSFDYDTQRSVYFRSHPSPASSSGLYLNTKLIDAVHASSTPPILYFNHPALVDKGRYWDGGVAGLNNPVLVAVLEGMISTPNREAICVLSLGTGTVRLPVDDDNDAPEFITTRSAESGILTDLKTFAACILDDPPDAASFDAYVALGLPMPSADAMPLASPRFVRLNPRLGPVKTGNTWSVPPYFQGDDGLTKFKKLTNMHLDAIEKKDVDAIKDLAEAWVTGDRVPNQGIRSDSDYHVQIGYAEAADGIEAWKAACNLAPSTKKKSATRRKRVKLKNK
jgi:hypothetical protein